MRSSIVTATALLAAFVLFGCHTSTTPTVEQAEKVASKPDWKLVTFHIDGFKKSKSGGT